MSVKPLDNVGRISTDTLSEWLGICLKRFKNKGLSERQGAKLIGIDPSTFNELKKGANGDEFTLGEKVLFRIRKFVTNGKRGARKYKSIRPMAGLWASDSI